jgi:hypothetical protein
MREYPMEDFCGARTRAGGKCRRARCENRPRCNLHGGKSLVGHMHPRYKHGLYSKHVFILCRPRTVAC